MNNQQRSAPLDLSRFIAAVIVLLGHFIFIDSNLYLLTKIWFISFFKSGAHAVLFFFTLSGFVLMRKSRNINLNWLAARLVRLLPVYLFCFVTPIIALAIAAPEELGRYPVNGIILALFASQALSSEYYLTGPNSPLWTLSVEVWLSGILVFFAPLKKPLSYLIYCLFFVLLSFYVNNPIINGVPYFFLGIAIARFNEANENILAKLANFKAILFLPLIAYWFIFPIIGIDLKLSKLSIEMIDLVCIAFTLTFFLTLRFGQKLSNVANYLGKRSFALYAVHAPILRAYSQFVEFILPKQDSLSFELTYLIFGLTFVAIATEVVYKFVDVPAIKLASRIRS
jgi:peptidoglycan/LPS O-acetylase OafA/YrhL